MRGAFDLGLRDLFNIYPGLGPFKEDGARAFISPAVKKARDVAGAHAQHAAGVVAGFFRKNGFAADDKVGLGAVEAGSGHGLNAKRKKREGKGGGSDCCGARAGSLRHFHRSCAFEASACG